MADKIANIAKKAVTRTTLGFLAQKTGLTLSDNSDGTVVIAGSLEQWRSFLDWRNFGVEASVSAGMGASGIDLLAACKAFAKYEAHQVSCDACSEGDHCEEGVDLWDEVRRLNTLALARLKRTQATEPVRPVDSPNDR